LIAYVRRISDAQIRTRHFPREGARINHARSPRERNRSVAGSVDLEAHVLSILPRDGEPGIAGAEIDDQTAIRPMFLNNIPNLRHQGWRRIDLAAIKIKGRVCRYPKCSQRVVTCGCGMRCRFYGLSPDVLIFGNRIGPEVNAHPALHRRS